MRGKGVEGLSGLQRAGSGQNPQSGFVEQPMPVAGLRFCGDPGSRPVFAPLRHRLQEPAELRMIIWLSGSLACPANPFEPVVGLFY